MEEQEYSVQDLQDNLDYLNETKGMIKQAIIDKGQTIQDSDTFRSYVDKIAAIETGIDTSDATAVASDILAPKTAYADGVKLTGTIDKVYLPPMNSNALNTSTNTFCDISSDGKTFAKVSGKTIYIYKVVNGNLTQIFTQATGTTYDGTSCRIANLKSIDGRLNVFIGAQGHDSDVRQIGCLRINLNSDNYPVSKETYKVSANMADGCDGNWSSLYPHPTKSSVVVAVFPSRDDRGTFIKSMQVNETTGDITLKNSTAVSLKYDSDWSGAYDWSLGQWGTDTMFYIQDTNLTTNYRLIYTFSGDEITAVSSSSLITSPTGFKSFVESFKFANRCLYSVNGTTIYKEYSSEQVGMYTHIHYVNDVLFISTILENGDFYIYTIDYKSGTYDLDQVFGPYNTNITTPFNNTGTGHLFDKLRFTSIYASGTGTIVVFPLTGFEYLGYDIKGTTYFDTNSATVESKDLLDNKIAYNSTNRVIGSMPNNGALNITPGDSAVAIPLGYTSGGTVSAVDITTLDEYKTCLSITEDILGTGV